MQVLAMLATDYWMLQQCVSGAGMSVDLCAISGWADLAKSQTLAMCAFSSKETGVRLSSSSLSLARQLAGSGPSAATAAVAEELAEVRSASHSSSSASEGASGSAGMVAHTSKPSDWPQQGLWRQMQVV
jgi:hypothetical protein